jgi:hypothetical protein
MLILLNNSAPMPLVSYEIGFDATFAVDIGIQSAIPRIGNDCSWRLIFCCLGQIVLLKGSFLLAYFTYSLITLHDTSISASNAPIHQEMANQCCKTHLRLRGNSDCENDADNTTQIPLRNSRW